MINAFISKSIAPVWTCVFWIKSKKAKQNVEKLASQAQDLRDLLSKIEKQRLEIGSGTFFAGVASRGWLAADESPKETLFELSEQFVNAI